MKVLCVFLRQWLFTLVFVFHIDICEVYEKSKLERIDPSETMCFPFAEHINIQVFQNWHQNVPRKFCSLERFSFSL